MKGLFNYVFGSILILSISLLNCLSGHADRYKQYDIDMEVKTFVQNDKRYFVFYKDNKIVSDKKELLEMGVHDIELEEYVWHPTDFFLVNPNGWVEYGVYDTKRCKNVCEKDKECYQFRCPPAKPLIKGRKYRVGNSRCYMIEFIH